MAIPTRVSKIIFSNNGDLVGKLGILVLYGLREDATLPSGNPSLLADWKTIEAWLDCAGRELNIEDEEKFAHAWRVYQAKGIAPSRATQPSFEKFADMAHREKWPQTSLLPEIKDVFDRRIAFDEDIRIKSQADLQRIASTTSTTGEEIGSSEPTTLAAWKSLAPHLLASALLLWALFPFNPYSYYSVMRWIVSALFIFLAVQSYEKRRDIWVWIWGVTAGIYNPLLPVHATRDFWSVLNVATVAILVYAATVLLRTRKI